MNIAKTCQNEEAKNIEINVSHNEGSEDDESQKGEKDRDIVKEKKPGW